ncbi:biotin--[acetyl-CoA-carboxylase] ligase [Bernardetia sp. OM2101]|uniref:biotin--[acetyl-CoA-carboxylase] ligase n=1 Tax=Bernardetia sp. OM2101 TaxID=3344876 RepID=UPI0035CFB85E
MTNYKIHTKGLFIGQNQIYLPSCQSTNESLAKRVSESKKDVEKNAPNSIFEGTLLWTNHQTQGKGQRGNHWVAQENQNLTFSILLNPTFLSPKESFWITIAVSLGVRDALEEVLKVDYLEMADELMIKWTNDIFVNYEEEDRKIGGILIENQISSQKINQSIIGIGININQIFDKINTENRAISLKELTNKDWNKEEILTEILFFIEKHYLQLRAGKKDSLRADYLSHLFRYQEWHYYKDKLKNQKITGQILGINPEGKLALEIAGQNGKITYFENKEIEFVY